MANITLVDDDENIVASIVIALEAQGHRIQTFHDGAAGLHGLQTLPPDLAILDVKMPRMDGLEVLKRFRLTSTVPVIMLTSKDSEIDEILGFNFGADDYIHKPFSQRLLLERVKALLRRASEPAYPENSPASTTGESKTKRFHCGNLMLDPARHECRWMDTPVKLTVTEFLILEALARRPGYVKSRDNLMDAAYDDQMYVDDRTIDSHIKRMRKKLKFIDPEFNALETLYGVGYRYNEH